MTAPAAAARCAGCGLGAHRYSTADPHHHYDAMACVNALRAENERLLALTEADTTSIFHEAAVLAAALREIASEDWRGHKPHCITIAERALVEAGLSLSATPEAQQ